MIRRSLQIGDKLVMEPGHLQLLIEVLDRRGYQVKGPVIRDGTIVYDDLASIADLPAGWTDEQEGGRYRLRKRTDESLFGYAVGPHSWKRFLYPPAQRLWQAKREGNGFKIVEGSREVPGFAFIGVRPCELHAIAIQDKVFMGGKQVAPSYKSRREGLFIVAVNCGEAGGTCFCGSMNTGPHATSGFDLALTEVPAGDSRYFVVEAGTGPGLEFLQEIPCREANEGEKTAAKGIVAKTARQMGRTMETSDIKGLLYRNYEHPRWDDVAARCLTCANCTMVCPTCFCTTVEDVTDITGEKAERWQKVASCFTVDFSYIHGGSIRSSPKARYRQWMTHKLATWIDQFGRSGCVGCGRCITWCPVAIDITEEVRAIRESVTQSQA